MSGMNRTGIRAIGLDPDQYRDVSSYIHHISWGDDLNFSEREEVYSLFKNAIFSDKLKENEIPGKLYDLWAKVKGYVFRQMIYLRLQHFEANLKDKDNSKIRILSQFLKVIGVVWMTAPRVHEALEGEEVKDEYKVANEEVMQYFGWPTPEDLVVDVPAENTPEIGEMVGLVCEDEPQVRGLLEKMAGKIGFKSVLPSLDTRPDGRKLEDIERKEDEAIAASQVIITDVNDTDDTNDPSGGLRRGKKALEQGKFVVFISGAHTNNEAKIHEEFQSQYEGRYIFIPKPIMDFKAFIEQVQALVKPKTA